MKSIIIHNSLLLIHNNYSLFSTHFFNTRQSTIVNMPFTQLFLHTTHPIPLSHHTTDPPFHRSIIPPIPLIHHPTIPQSQRSKLSTIVLFHHTANPLIPLFHHLKDPPSHLSTISQLSTFTLIHHLTV